MTRPDALLASTRRAAAERFRAAGVEPRLGELWSDPVFLAVLKRDRLSVCDVRAAIAAAGIPAR
ncbi:hypothetical protein KL86APRO_10061 [uncultured Alphaproteobacteria bacterium]|uniref:Uncharacterized protein n=1 Tax=uncultured Alphaproteobacteria bacterium TaxID=91750 RepID=A0A212IUS0_9PROT|nr:hypothetical protein KL86APRO_10061 [uncultured Alphaproteobacteria bacterium]